MGKPVHPLIGELREIRKSQRLSQDAVGAAIGKVATAMTAYESGQHSPKIDTLCQWADTLGYDVVLKPKD